MFRDATPSAIYMGILAAFVGYSASAAIVLTGLTSVGASPDQAATGLFFASLAMGIGSIWLPWITRTPAAVAWSTPGAAFFAASVALPGGFAETIGAMIAAAFLIVLTGLIPALGRLVSAIPKPIANALLAGVLVKLCFAPALALGEIPLLVLPVMAAWLVGLSWHRLAAMPFAVLAFLVVLFFAVEMPTGGTSQAVTLLPSLEPIWPIFTAQAFISVAIPLYLVTMAGQNIPGFAVLELNGYAVSRQPLLRKTGLISLAFAPFGAIPANMSAITAAMMVSEDAGRDPSKRYVAAMTSGFVYIGLTFAAASVASLLTLAPPLLITAIAGLALIPAFTGALSGALTTPNQLEAPALTFLISASGMTLLGISGAFWGLVLGTTVWVAKSWMASKTSV